MKKLLLLLLIFLSFLNAIEIDEYKTDVYFANGILTKKMDAISNTDLLEKSIKKKFFDNNEDEIYKQIGKVDYVYNKIKGTG